MRRLTLDELTRFPTLRQFFQKGPGQAGRPRAANEADQPPVSRATATPTLSRS